MPFFTDSQTILQNRYGGRKVAERLLKHRVKTEITSIEEQLIRSAYFFFIASGTGETIDCSIKSGNPGFVSIRSPTEIWWPDYDGNRMYRTLGNIRENPTISILFVDFDDPANKSGPERPTKLRIIGDATIDETSETVRQFYGSQRVVRLVVKHVFPNCPRYLPSMIITDTSKYIPNPGYNPPKPEWKTRDYIAEVLDEDE
jgi:hypothetical protein